MRSACGQVRIVVMKDHMALQVPSSAQDYRENLRAYAKIGLSEQGKLMTIQFVGNP